MNMNDLIQAHSLAAFPQRTASNKLKGELINYVLCGTTIKLKRELINCPLRNYDKKLKEFKIN